MTIVPNIQVYSIFTLTAAFLSINYCLAALILELWEGQVISTLTVEGKLHLHNNNVDV